MESEIPLLSSSGCSSDPRSRVAVNDVLHSPLFENPTALDTGQIAEHSSAKQRLVSLDVFRGLTVALMILVDDAGGAFPSINHSPWFGVTLADFVMPFFLFIVGVSVGLVFKKVSRKRVATMKVIMRTAKLFLVGLLLQGGYFHGRDSLTYGVDVDHIRWLGVLQRISVGYFLAAIAEIWLVSNVVGDSMVAFAKRYYIEWIFALVLCMLYLALIYGIYVPNWELELPVKLSAFGASDDGRKTEVVQCGVRGSLNPPCNAVGFIDRLLLGANHLYQKPVYRRTKNCSINSPAYGPIPMDSPSWCLAPFDPEGLLSSLMAAVTCLIGVHYGHIIGHSKSHKVTILLWCMSSLLLMLLGYGLVLLGVPLSKPLYTVSYMSMTAGVSGFVLVIIYYIVDIKNYRKPTILFQWVGMNAIIVYALAACDLFPAAVQGFYWRSPEKNLINLSQILLQSLLNSKKWGALAFTLSEIIFWCLVAGFLHSKRIYFKL